MKTFAVVGGGLAAYHALFYLLQEMEKKPLSHPWKILQWAEPSLAPPCSFSTTALCALRGAKRGTPRGEELAEGFAEAKDFIHRFRPLGVVQGKVASVCPPGHAYEEDYHRRFESTGQPVQHLPFLAGSLPQTLLSVTEEAFFFHPPLYFSWLQEAIAKKIQSLGGQIIWETKERMVLQLEKAEGGWKLWDNHGQSHLAAVVLLATGAYTKLLALAEKTPVVEKIQVQSGSYLEFPDQDLGEESWAINFLEKKILLYRHEARALLLVGASVAGAQWAPPFPELKKVYGEFRNLLGSSLGTGGKFPEFIQGRIRTGPRSKGIRRAPFWGEWPDEKGLYGFFSLYKNGLSYSFLGARELSRIMIREFIQNPGP